MSPFPKNHAAIGRALFALVCGLPLSMLAADFYVATTGDDAGAGTVEAPFATIMRAQAAATEGDTVYVRGGTYSTFAIAFTDANYNYVHRLDKNDIHWSAYPGETPVLNFASIPTNLRVCGFQVLGSGIKITGFHVTGTPVGAQKQSECFRIEGNDAYAEFYDCAAYDNAANGFYFTSGARGACIRCDAYNNIGTNSDAIGNTDGFGAHGNGVVFRYCRAWNNSDDGFDCISSAGSNTFDHCWSFNHRLGGNKAGFKTGGFGADPNTVPPNPVPVHIVTYCVSAFNGAQGFYANHQPGQAAFWTKNTAFNNSSGNFNMLERTADMAMDIPGVLEVLHYNIAFMGTAITQANLPPANVTENSWTKPGVTVSAADFLSTDWTQLTAPRSAGNNMPFVTFMHLAPGSDLAGLGAFDPPPAAPTGLTAVWVAGGRVDLSWTASPGATTYYVKRATSPGGPYTTIAARLTDTHYSDATATDATSYYYAVTAMDDFSYDESASSNEAAAIQGPVAVVTGITPDTGLSVSDGITNAATLILTGHAADTTGAAGAGSTISVVRAGFGVIGTTTADAGGVWSFDYTGTSLTEGAHAFSAIASNNGHAGVESAPFNVVVDTTPPAAPVVAAASGAPLVFVGTAEAGSIVTLDRAGVGVAGSTTADDSGHWTLVSDITLETGSALFTATAADPAGNTSPVSEPLGLDTGIAVPAITAVAPDNGISDSDALTNSPTLTLSGVSAPGATVVVARADLGLIGSTAADGSGQWSLDYTGTTLAAGSYIFRAAAHENGNFSPFSADFPVTIDTVAPAVDAMVRHSPAFPTLTPSIASAVYRVTFTKPVYGVSPGDFALSTTGDASGSVTAVSASSGTVFDVTIGSLSGEGEIRLEVNGGAIIDAAGNAVPVGFNDGQFYTRAAVSLGSGIWTRTATGGRWSDEANWQDLVIADGAASSANFSTLDLAANNTVQLDSPRTLNRLSFGDTLAATAASWMLDAGGSPANTLTLAGGSPTVTVNALGTNATTTIAAPLAGTAGFTKDGPGVLALAGANTLTGGLNLQAGTVRLPAGGSLALDANSTITGLGALQVAGGSFSTSAPALLDGATVSQSAGTIAFDGGLTATGNGNVFITLSGGTFTAQGIDIQRSSDGSINYARGLVVTGGTATVGSLQLGSVNSNGLASVEGGTLHVLGPVTIGSQTTSGRGGALRITSGSFTVEDTTEGLVLSKVNGTNANNVSQANFLGGTSSVGKITLGFDETMTAGSGTVTINGGALYIGSGGIVKNGAAGMTTTITFTAGTLGAAADWTTTHPIVFSGTGAKTVRAANAAGDPFDITLAGVLSSTGPLIKTGGGTLTLSGVNTRTGVTTINEGVLSVGTIANGGTASNLGQAALAATNLVINGGTLRYTGAGSSHNRLFSIGTNGATLDASGTGAWIFNSPTALTVSGTGSRTLTLTGTNSEGNTLATPIPNPSSGTTALVKNGTGTWVLSAASTFTGEIAVNAGTLEVTGSLAAGGAVTVDNGGTLAGTGTINKTIALNSGGLIAPAGAATGTLTAASLTWNGGGALATNLGATSDRLTLTGTLSKGSAGTYRFDFSGTPAIGTVHTLASFGSTTFTAADFSYSGLSGVGGTFAISGNTLTFTVTELPDAAFNAWAAGLPAGQRGALDDPDGDGLANLLEFALGTDGGQANVHPGSTGVTTSDGAEYPTYTYTRRIARGGAEIIVGVSASLDFSATLGAVELSATPSGDGLETVVVRSAVPLSTQPRQFFRLSASLPSN
jgi:autotransporter-associated beta strand protein